MHTTQAVGNGQLLSNTNTITVEELFGIRLTLEDAYISQKRVE